MAPTLALAAMLLAGARAEEPRGQEPEVVAHEAPALSLQTTLDSPQAWMVVEQGFPDVFRGYLRQIEAAAPNRYFPKTLVWVKRGLDAHGHFLDARCGTLRRNRPCPSKASALERRVVAVSLLRVLPTGRRPEVLFDDSLFLVTPEGERALGETQRRFPDLWERAYRLAAEAL